MTAARLSRLGLRAVLLVSVLGAALAQSGCTRPRKDGVDVSTLTHPLVDARLRQSAARRVSLSGTYTARLPGIEGVVVNATVDVAARAPGDLNIGVRSFFEVPQQVLVASNVDGQSVITLYDATSGAPVFSRGPASERTLGRVIGVPLLPDDAVSLLLGRPPLDVREGYPAARVRLLDVDETRGTYRASIERAGRGAVVVDVDAKDDAVVGATLARGDGRRLATVRVVAHVDVDGVRYPRQLLLRVEESGQEVILEVKDVDFGAVVLDEAFVLEPPEGTPIRSL